MYSIIIISNWYYESYCLLLVLLLLLKVPNMEFEREVLAAHDRAFEEWAFSPRSLLICGMPEDVKTCLTLAKQFSTLAPPCQR